MIQYCVNGLTPTGDGNTSPDFLLRADAEPAVLMALPQQGTETRVHTVLHNIHDRVNGLTPTGDGNNALTINDTAYDVLMALPQQGTETICIVDKIFLFKEVLMALPQQGTETSSTFLLLLIPVC